MKKQIVLAATITIGIASLVGCKPADKSASTIQPNEIVDTVTNIVNANHNLYFETKYGWAEVMHPNQIAHVGDTVQMRLNTNGHSPNIEDWYTDQYTIIKHKK